MHTHGVQADFVEFVGYTCVASLPSGEALVAQAQGRWAPSWCPFRWLPNLLKMVGTDFASP